MTAKICTKCKEAKATTEFNKHRDSLTSQCKTCLSENLRAYRKTDASKAAMKSYWQSPTGREKIKEHNRSAIDKMTVVEVAAMRSTKCARARSDLSSPDLYGVLSFTEASAMTVPFVEERLRLEQETGVAHHIDHIIPLTAGGTHTKENLQVLTAQEN